MSARVVVLAGPSGAGKSHLAERLGLPVLRLDDFYRSGGDPALPVIEHGPNTGMTDWDHPDSWLGSDAVAAVRSLCTTGRAEVPLYDLARDGRYGTHALDLRSSPLFVAEGIFAQEIVPELAASGDLAAAYCITQHPAVTFTRRLVRDLHEHRKPPLVLLKRGFALMRAQQRVVDAAAANGCRVASAHTAYGEITTLAAVRPEADR